MNVRNESQYKKKKENILEAYYQLVGENGFEKVTLVNLAGRLGITPSLVLHYFKNKREMTLEFVDYVLKKCTEESSVLQRGESDDPKKEFLDYIDYMFAQGLESDLIETKVFFDCHSLALRDEEVWKKFKLHHDHVIEGIKKELDLFVQRGGLALIDTKLASCYIFSVTTGLADYRDFSENPEEFARVVLDQKQAVLRYMNV